MTRTFATAVQLVRSALRHPPLEDELDEARELELQVAQAEAFTREVAQVVEHLDESERVSLISMLARVAMTFALQMPADRRELLLSLMAGEAEAAR